MGDRSHLVDAKGNLLCPEAEARDAMDDGEFWDHVAGNRSYDPADDSNLPAEDAAEYEMGQRLGSPCPECGQQGACAYDLEGRALIHVTTDDEETP